VSGKRARQTLADIDAWLATRPRNPAFTPLGYLDDTYFFRSANGQLLAFNGCNALYRRKAILRLVDGDTSEILRLFTIAHLGAGFSPSAAGPWIMCMAADAGILLHPERRGFVRNRDGRWIVAVNKSSRRESHE
jgi:hypothetical protein